MTAGSGSLGRFAQDAHDVDVEIAPQQARETLELGRREAEALVERAARLFDDRFARARKPARSRRSPDPIEGREPIDAHAVAEMEPEEHALLRRELAEGRAHGV